MRLTLSTHSEGGLTDADHALARRIDAVDGGLISDACARPALATLAASP